MRIIVGLFTLITLVSCGSSPLTEKKQMMSGINFSLYGRHEVETRKRVLIVDTGLDKVDMVKDFMCRDFASIDEYGDHYDYNGHGTNITSIINVNMDKSKFCITMLRVHLGKPELATNYLKSLVVIPYLTNSLAIINMSLEGAFGNQFEFAMIKSAVAHGVIVNVAAGNGGLNLDWGCGVFPACYGVGLPRGLFNVISNNGNYANKGQIVDFMVQDVYMGTPKMRGTSQSTAYMTGLMVSK